MHSSIYFHISIHCGLSTSLLAPLHVQDAASQGWNPGAGVPCEGEDWTRMLYVPTLHVSVAHVYDRQMESVPPKWNR